MSRGRRGESGQTLVEVTVATLLIAVAAIAVFPLILSARRGTGKTGAREEMAYHAHRLAEALKAYVTADVGVSAGAPGDTPWHLPGDSCPGQSPGCWALAAGDHDVTANLPASLSGSPVDARLTYRVSETVLNSEVLRRAEIQSDWSGP